MPRSSPWAVDARGYTRNDFRPARTDTYEHTITGLLSKRTDLFNEAIGHFFMQPREIENPVDPRKDVVVRHQLPERAAHVEFELIAFLAPAHSVASDPHVDNGRESGTADFFNSPPSTS